MMKSKHFIYGILIITIIGTILISGCILQKPTTTQPAPKLGMTFTTGVSGKDVVGREIQILPNAYSGEAYSREILGQGGAPPYNCELTSGSLPGTLQFVDCTIIGNAPVISPTSTSKTFPFNFKITDANGSVGGPFELTLIVRHRPPILKLPQNIGPAIIGESFEHSFCDKSSQLLCDVSPIVSGGVPPYTFSASSLPIGFTMESNGLLKGTVPEAYKIEDREITICVKDAASFETCGAIALIITPAAQKPQAKAPLIVQELDNLPPGTFGSYYEYNFVVSGGTPPYSIVRPDPRRKGIPGLPLDLDVEGITIKGMIHPNWGSINNKIQPCIKDSAGESYCLTTNLPIGR